jgi:hypothetical protein
MKLLLKIAFRNMLRNLRRSTMTGSAVAAGALAMMLFGGFTSYIFAGLETTLAARSKRPRPSLERASFRPTAKKCGNGTSSERVAATFRIHAWPTRSRRAG